MDPSDLKRIAKTALRELGAGDPPLTITSSDDAPDCWRIAVGGSETITLSVRAGAGTAANHVREQIVSQFSGR